MAFLLRAELWGFLDLGQRSLPWLRAMVHLDDR